MGTLALIGLGSNLGDRKATLDAAVADLGELPDCMVRAVSSYHETEPVGGPEGQGAFLNAAAAVETALEPMDLLHALQDIERRLGRVRTVRWGERTLDLDLLLHGDLVLRTRPVINRVFGGQFVELQVPHPRMALRRFVLAPLAEIAPGAVDPLTGRTISDLLANLDRRPGHVTMFDPGWMFGKTIFADALLPGLVAELAAVGFRYAQQREAYRKRSLGYGELVESWFAQLRDDLSLERWSSRGEDDRWLVTDFWLDAMLSVTSPNLDDRHILLERLFEVRAATIAPTFVIVARGGPRNFPRSGFQWPAPLFDAPMFAIDPDGPSEKMVEEVLAACRATRTG